MVRRRRRRSSTILGRWSDRKGGDSEMGGVVGWGEKEQKREEGMDAQRNLKRSA